MWAIGLVIDFYLTKPIIMKQSIKFFTVKMILTSLMLLAFNAILFAQDKVVVVDTAEAGNWFSRNWMYVAGGVLLLVILFAIGSSSSRSKSVTTRETNDGITRTTSTTTTDTDY